MLKRWTLVAALATAVVPLGDKAGAQTARVDFGAEVLPILRERCFSCHDGRKGTAGFRLDVRSRALQGGESKRPGIVVSKPDASEIYLRIISDDDAKVMPSEGAKLSAAQIATIKRWIEQGAHWPDELANEASNAKHWAFVPPKRPALPKVSNPSWVKSPIDAFVLARLDREKLQPSPPADAATLCRRMYLDLIGLPPSPKELDDFLLQSAIRNPQSAIPPLDSAVESLADKLLASPHYGERWGRIWLDAARYADSDGFEKDKPRFVWFYRDWVVNALNRDLPYDRFIVEQLAGDLLPNPTQDQIVATGFLRNSMINEEGGIDPEQFRMESMFDRMDAIGKGVLGLTIQCAQCHDHKYDPLRQADYYRMFAFLNNSHEANVAVYTPAEQQKRADLLRQVGEIENDLKHRTPDWSKRMAAWEATVIGNQPKWTVVRPSVLEESTGGEKYLPQPDGSFLCLGYAPTKHRVHLTAKVAEPSISGFRIELLNDPNLPRGGPGRSIEGTAALSEFDVEAAPAEQPNKPTKVKFTKATADVETAEIPIKSIYSDKSNKRRVIGPVVFAIDGKDDTAWGIDIDPGRRNQPRKAVFVPDKPIQNPKGTVLHFHLKQNHGGWNSDDNQNHNLGRFRLSITNSPNPQADPLPAAVREILVIPADKRTARQTEAVFQHWRTTVAEWRDANARIDALWKQHPEGTTQLALAEREATRPTHMLKRGDFLKPGYRVGPGVPSFLHAFPKDAPANRLGFAQWMVDLNSPTTARSFVNRVWQAYFGTGLVATSEDLGLQSEAPSHPELLDWLACALASGDSNARGDVKTQNGVDHATTPNPASAIPWSIKRLHKLIVLSSTYQQASRMKPDMLAKDPSNRLLARGPRFRVDAEIVRDIALSASGLLNPKVGGPSVFPPLPAFLVLPPASYGPKVWKESAGADRFRRSLYTFRFRSIPYPPLENFDSPNGDFSCVRRPRSNTPLQALTAMNEPIFLECAQALAARILRESGQTDSARIEYGFRLCVARKPTAAEADELKALLNEERTRFAAKSAKPTDLVGKSDRYPANPPSAESAAWVALARVLLNLDETMTKE